MGKCVYHVRIGTSKCHLFNLYSTHTRHVYIMYTKSSHIFARGGVAHTACDAVYKRGSVHATNALVSAALHNNRTKTALSSVSGHDFTYRSRSISLNHPRISRPHGSSPTNHHPHSSLPRLHLRSPQPCRSPLHSLTFRRSPRACYIRFNGRCSDRYQTRNSFNLAASMHNLFTPDKQLL